MPVTLEELRKAVEKMDDNVFIVLTNYLRDKGNELVESPYGDRRNHGFAYLDLLDLLQYLRYYQDDRVKGGSK